MVPVHEYQNLILAVGIQTAGKSLWNIQATMIECKHVSLSWKGWLTKIIFLHLGKTEPYAFMSELIFFFIYYR